MIDSKMTGRQTLLGQFLVPILSAVFLIGLSVAFVSKWFAERSTERIAIDRMRSIGGLLTNAPFPLTPKVLNQIEQLTGLQFALFAVEGDELTSILTSSSSLSDGLQQQIKDAIVVDREYSTIHLGETNKEAFLSLTLPSNANKLIVLDRVRHPSFLGISFLLPLITGLISSIGIGIVATWTASHMTNRIAVLKSEVQQIAMGRVYEEVEPGPSDDIRSLQLALYKMSQELADSKKQIAANERSRLIQLMASGLVHELRNHLTGARLALQTCATDSVDQEALSIATQQMDLAERQLRRLLTIHTQHQNSEDRSLRVADILSNTVKLIQPMADHRNVNLIAVPPFHDLPAMVDISKDTIMNFEVSLGESLTGALLNLLINGIEAAGPGGHVELLLSVEALQDSSNARVLKWKVRDSGPGPSADVAERLFEPFTTSKREGVGLGLAMCKRVAGSLGGSIQWRRTQQMTEFEIEFPIHMKS